MMLGEKWQKAVRSWTRRVLTCESCGQQFRQINNIGRWRCSQHWWPGFPPKKGEKWRCCGKVEVGTPSWKSEGCVPADHTLEEVPYDTGHDLLAPKTVFSFVRTARKSVVSDLSEEGTEAFSMNVRIRRFDLAEAVAMGMTDPFLDLRRDPPTLGSSEGKRKRKREAEPAQEENRKQPRVVV